MLPLVEFYQISQSVTPAPRVLLSASSLPLHLNIQKILQIQNLCINIYKIFNASACDPPEGCYFFEVQLEYGSVLPSLDSQIH